MAAATQLPGNAHADCKGSLVCCAPAKLINFLCTVCSKGCAAAIVFVCLCREKERERERESRKRLYGNQTLGETQIELKRLPSGKPIRDKEEASNSSGRLAAASCISSSANEEPPQLGVAAQLHRRPRKCTFDLLRERETLTWAPPLKNLI